ncbi:hypothetical protein DSM100685_1805 [Bifidobacterium avesanii]|nr:hypothetical protein DSM100685_1805 [Bifidobacterium avesanii]
MAAVECDDNENPPAILYPGDVADIMRELQTDEYRKARRAFSRRLGIDPRDVGDPEFRGYVTYLFNEWLTYDVRLDEDNGLTPFDFVAMGAYGRGLLSEGQFEDMREVSESNFVSWFWMLGVSAATRLVRIEDLASGEVYEIRDAETAARYDGAPGGSMVARLARVRDAWHFVSPPPAVLREPYDDRERRRVTMLVQMRQPDFLGLLATVLTYNPVYAEEVRRHRARACAPDGGPRAQRRKGGRR